MSLFIKQARELYNSTFSTANLKNIVTRILIFS